MTTIDDTKTIKNMVLPLQCEWAFNIETYSVYILRIYINLTIQTSDQKINLPGWNQLIQIIFPSILNKQKCLMTKIRAQQSK